MSYALQPRIPVPNEPIIDGVQLTETQDIHVFDGVQFVRTERNNFYRDVVTGALVRIEIEVVEECAR
jgi:hypothetical protein